LNIESLARAHYVSVRTVTRFRPAQKNADGRDLAGKAAGESRGHRARRVNSVSQAALDFGFSDFSHFSHAFRKAFGVSPSTLLHRDRHGL
jgi:AraC-like DNA-binding protein